MAQTRVGRRQFLAGAGIVGVASVQALTPAAPAAGAPAAATPPTAPESKPAGYTYFRPSEAAFVEALVDHMVPQAELTGSGTEIGIATYIDRALAGSWGTDRANSALNKYLQSWDLPNVFVMGASAFSHNSGDNPTGPFGALAFWAATAIRDKNLKHPGPLM